MSAVATTTIRIPRGLHQMLSEQACRREISMSSVIEQALNQMLDDEFWGQFNEAFSNPEVAAQMQDDLAQWGSTMGDGLEDEDWSWLKD